MLTTLTNVSGRALNVLETYTGGEGPSALSASGGNRTDPLPYPFSHIGEFAIAGTKQLAMHERDFYHEQVVGSGQKPSKQWQGLIQAGVVTLTNAAETNDVDAEDLFLGDCP